MQKASGPKVADWQDVGLEKNSRDYRCRIGSARARNRSNLRTDFRDRAAIVV